MYFTHWIYELSMRILYTPLGNQSQTGMQISPFITSLCSTDKQPKQVSMYRVASPSQLSPSATFAHTSSGCAFKEHKEQRIRLKDAINFFITYNF
jgi:hypothetical protein